jgi:hypothetical protein
MWRWLQRRNRGRVLEPEVLGGAPLRTRIKTYSSANGHVYQYVYRGRRSILAAPNVRPGQEYVFQVNRTPGNSGRVAVQLLDAEINGCRKYIARELLDSERYAIAKLSLFATFDEAEDFSALSDPIIPSAQRMQQCLETLGRL